MKQMYRQETGGYKWWQQAVLIGVLIFIATCSAALLLAIGAQIIKQL